jgi:hypothetical protein
MRSIPQCRFAVGAALLALSAAASAAPTGYQSQSDFAAAIAGLSAQTVDFESVPVGTTFASGTGTGGLTFAYDIPGYSLQVSNTFGTTSGTNYLGLDNPDTAFYLGDSFTISFGRTVTAAGLYLIAGNDAEPGDLELSTATANVFNGTTPLVLSDGKAYFLGLVDSAGFDAITITGVASGDAFLPFSADDITSAVASVPEPGMAATLLAGVGLLLVLARRRLGASSTRQ